jgi:IS30 family transposase
VNQEQYEEALRLRAEGVSFTQIALRLGVSVGTVSGVMRRRAGYGKARKRSYLSRPYATGAKLANFEMWQKRPVRRVIKPPSDVIALARQFAAGVITRAEFMHAIRAEATP